MNLWGESYSKDMPNKSHKAVQNSIPVNASSNRGGVVQSNSFAALVSEKPSNGKGMENMEEEWWPLTITIQ